MPRQPYSAAVKSDRRSGSSLALLERERAWEWVKDPLFARGGQGSRKIYDNNKNRTTIPDRII
jgi:hypothetical protein